MEIVILNHEQEINEVACGGEITDPEKYPSAVYKGKRVYFCTSACLRAFEEQPDKFMAGEIDHPEGL